MELTVTIHVDDIPQDANITKTIMVTKMRIKRKVKKEIGANGVVSIKIILMKKERKGIGIVAIDITVTTDSKSSKKKERKDLIILMNSEE